ncbi:MULTISPECIES: hypothetical protein [Thiomicrorhabdus]|uniref:Carboxypeptidase regulatory-like domain-containing protein n=1 Tax=Thiomicrorhabdus heinhorstiae TaxID=2748010 RepID=A0ABS0C4F3_9GAMM|nr:MULTISPECIES: hypothetical protein [Thiomicrorhabdus]MBF6059011.1 hypothetical protein [Thiomicrorhabdus heinhorstiae]
MLNTNLKVLFLAISSTVLGASLSGCSSSSDPDTISSLEVTEKALEITGRIVDATTGDAIDGATITVSGTDVASIDMENATTLPGGIVTYSADKQDISLNLLAQKDGYLDTGIELSTANTDLAEFIIRMVKIDNPPVGTAVTQQDVSGDVDAGGVVTNEITVSAKVTNSTSVNDEQTQIVIPAGTDLLDKDGNPVTGTIKVTVAHHSANEESSTDAFPGGFAVLATTSDPNATEATQENITFVTAGFTSITVENENGDKVRQFGNNDIEVKMQIKEGTINPDTGVAIAIGDTVPVWSYDEDTGKWSYEQDGTVADLDGADGFYDVVVQASHLSYWNLDWHYSAVCSNLTLNIVNSQGGLLTGENVYVRAAFTNSAGYLYSGYIRNDGYAKLFNFPLNRELKLTALIDGAEVGSKTTTVTQSMCDSSGVINLSVPTSALPVKYPVTVRAKSMCANGQVDDDNLRLFSYLYAGGKYLTYGYTPVTAYAAEGSEFKTYIYKPYINGTIDGTDYYGYYSTKTLMVSNNATDNVIEYTVTLDGNTQACLDAASTTGATTGTTTGSTDLNVNQ